MEADAAEIAKCKQVIHTGLYSSRAFDVLRKIMNAEDLVDNDRDIVEKVFNKQTARVMKKAGSILAIGCACIDQSTNEILIGPFEPEYDSLIDDLEDDGIDANDVCRILGELIKAVCSEKTTDLKFKAYNYAIGLDIPVYDNTSHVCKVKIADANVVADFLLNVDMSKYDRKLVDSIVGKPNNFIAVEAILSLDREKAALKSKFDALAEEARNAYNAKIDVVKNEYVEKKHAIDNEHSAALDMIHNEYAKQLAELEADINKLRGRKLPRKHLVSLS